MNKSLCLSPTGSDVLQNASDEIHRLAHSVYWDVAEKTNASVIRLVRTIKSNVLERVNEYITK